MYKRIVLRVSSLVIVSEKRRQRLNHQHQTTKKHNKPCTYTLLTIRGHSNTCSFKKTEIEWAGDFQVVLQTILWYLDLYQCYLNFIKHWKYFKTENGYSFLRPVSQLYFNEYLYDNTFHIIDSMAPTWKTDVVVKSKTHIVYISLPVRLEDKVIQVHARPDV